MHAEPLSQLTESVLIDSFIKGEESSFSKLYDTYSVSLFGMILGMTRDLKVSEAILQQTFIIASENSNDFHRSNQRFYTWILCIARKLISEAHTINEFNVDLQIQSEPNSVSDNVVLSLICLKGFSFSEAAKTLNVTEAQLKIMFKNELHHYKTIISKK